MLIDFVANGMTPLAATDDGGFIATLLNQIVLWGRVALGIGLVIFVHELGHFVAAKTFGVKCEKFYVGFDVPIRIGPIKFPRTLGRFRYGETEYGIGIIPLGGYVKMLGQDDDPRKHEEEAQRIRVEEQSDDSQSAQLDPRSFPAKPVWQRMVIISAGVIMNVITGILFAAIAYGYGVSYTPAIVGAVTPGGPAWQAGIEPGGRVIAVGTWQDQNMHFREMQTEILTRGLEDPEAPIDIAIEYDDGVRHFKLKTQPRPDIKEARMIGLAMPLSPKLAKDPYAVEGTVAADVLTPDDAGATIVRFDSTPIDLDSIVPAAPLFDHLYRHPRKTITLGLKRVELAPRDVDLPAQPAKSLGIRFAVGPVVALVKEGPAESAGMQVGDQIVAVEGLDSVDAYGLALALVGKTESVTFEVKREGENDPIKIDIQPVKSLQTLPPTASIAGEIAINAFGLAYQPLTQIESLDRSVSDLQPGDTIQNVRLIVDKDNPPEWVKKQSDSLAIEKLLSADGWEFTPLTSLNTLREVIQLFPDGTRLRIGATRAPDDRVITADVTVGKSDEVMFRRGLVLTPSTALQRAASVSEALRLGWKEGYRRLTDVVRFLWMIPQGNIKLKHVGGPLEIVNMAKHEAERGISPQLMFLTLLSMNLAILNFLPIPALDGGHMMFLIYEAVVGKRANEQLEFRLTVAGLLALLMLMIVVFANDILRHL